MKALYLFILSLCFATHAAKLSLPQDLDLSQCDSRVRFRAVGIPVVHILGGFQSQGHSLTGKMRVEADEITGAATVKLGTCETPVGKQTEYLKRELFNVERWPESVLNLTELKLPQDFWEKKFHRSKTSFKGSLTFRGEVRPVSGEVELMRQPGEIHLEFHFPVDPGLHGMHVAGFMGIQFVDKVDVWVDLSLPFKEMP